VSPGPGWRPVLVEDENGLGGRYGLDPVQPVWGIPAIGLLDYDITRHQPVLFAQLVR
jgi:hypothetical protein